MPNGGKRSKREAAKFVAMGVRAGIPDLVIILPGGDHVYVEIKIDSGTVSPAQKNIHNIILNLTGRPVHILKTSCPSQAIELLRAILRTHGAKC